MSSPFPGMDPFLEAPGVFPDLHNGLIFCLMETLQIRLPEPYFASTEARIWVETSQRTIRPDVSLLQGQGSRPTIAESGGGTAVVSPPRAEPVVVYVTEDEITETFLQIYAEHDDRRLVTSIEVLSPSNKRRGDTGRELYLQKQGEILRSQVHLVEIDLLRGGEPTTAVAGRGALDNAGGADYHVCIRQFNEPRKYVVYPILLSQALPEIKIPLLPDAAPMIVDMQTIFDRVYEAGPFRRSVDYERQPSPPLTPQQRKWAANVLRAKGKLGPGVATE